MLVRLSLFIIITFPLLFFPQKKTPLFFRVMEKMTSKRIDKYLAYDTMIENSQSKIHIYYSNKINKPYLLLLHGMGANAKINWYKQIKCFSKRYNLLIPDLIYFGKSTSSSNDYSVEFQAKQIKETLNKINITSKINVMGFSYGALTAAMFNEFYHNEVNKLIIIDGPVKYFSGELADSLARLNNVLSVKNILIPQNLNDYRALEKTVLSRKYLTTKKFKKKIMSYFFIPTIQSRTLQIEYLIKNQTIYQNYDYGLEHTPTMIIWGAKDGIIPISVGQTLHKEFPTTTKLVILKKSKHDGQFREPKKLNKTVTEFLKN
jgi:pimeloyl-ACP methyl ester carboxylesterase